MIALAAKAMADHGADSDLAAWLVLTGLFTTVPSLILLPAGTVPNDPGRQPKS